MHKKVNSSSLGKTFIVSQITLQQVLLTMGHNKAIKKNQIVYGT